MKDFEPVLLGERFRQGSQARSEMVGKCLAGWMRTTEPLIPGRRRSRLPQTAMRIGGVIAVGLTAPFVSVDIPLYAASPDPHIKTVETIVPPLVPEEAIPIEEGMFYNDTNGGASPEQGYFVRGQMWNIYRGAGRENVWGFPVSRQWTDGLGRVSQAFQRGIFQLTIVADGNVQQVEFANVFDELSRQGKDSWLEAVRSTPASANWNSDAGLPWEGVVANHLAVLAENPAIRTAFLNNPDWLNQYGLPMGYADFGNVQVLRAQRAVFQQWMEDVPWARKGEVIIALGGDIAKEAGGIIPESALVLESLSPVSPSPEPVDTSCHVPDSSHRDRFPDYSISGGEGITPRPDLSPPRTFFNGKFKRWIGPQSFVMTIHGQEYPFFAMDPQTARSSRRQDVTIVFVHNVNTRKRVQLKFDQCYLRDGDAVSLQVLDSFKNENFRGNGPRIFDLTLIRDY